MRAARRPQAPRRLRVRIVPDASTREVVFGGRRSPWRFARRATDGLGPVDARAPCRVPNTLVKTGMAAVAGSPELRRSILGPALAVLAAGVLVAIFLG